MPLGTNSPADVIGSSAYDSRNGDIGIAVRQGDHLLQFKLGEQRIGFDQLQRVLLAQLLCETLGDIQIGREVIRRGENYAA